MSSPITKVTGVRLPGKPPSSRWDISIASDGTVSSVDAREEHPLTSHQQPSVLAAEGRLLIPSLCHAHIHLDKCFLLQDPKYADLQIEQGDFKEAMSLTTEAKSRFAQDDLLRRGRQLIEESISYGVTAMRAFVEVDSGVEFKCLDTGLLLKREFAERCHVQLCAFAQLPLFSGEDGGDEIRRLMEKAMEIDGVEVVGSTPYVEDDEDKEEKNIEWIVGQALSKKKFLDLHLDYHLDESKRLMVHEVIRQLKAQGWKENGGKAITLGHCTRLTMFSKEEWRQLANSIKELPISFVGLPTSDLFMMRTESRVRGTLHIPQMIKEYGLQAAIAINNIGNAFTPQGNCDPLSVAQLGVGIYQAGTKDDADLLFDCVSARAKATIGVAKTSLDIRPGVPADFVLFPIEKPEWRTRTNIADIVYNAGAGGRVVIRAGKVVSQSS